MICSEDYVNVFDYLSGAQIDAVRSESMAFNLTDELYAASQAIVAQGGGDLIVPRGRYKIGKQTPNIESLYLQAKKNIYISSCAKRVRIISEGAVFVADPTLKFGSFDPITGEPIWPEGPFYEYDKMANAYVFLECVNNRLLHIEGFELDGNATNITLGGRAGDSGWQLSAHGMILRGNKQVSVDDVYTHDHACDGHQCINAGLTENSAPRPHVYKNVRSERNARLNLALTGGIGVDFIGCTFDDAGTVQNVGAGMVINSTPGCGIDIEAEGSVVRDVNFYGCRALGNWRFGLIAASGNSRRVSFRDSVIEGAVVGRPQYHFDNCTIIGKTDLALAVVDQYTGQPMSNVDRHTYRNTRFTYDAALTKTGNLVNSGQSTWNEDRWALFDECVIDTKQYPLPMRLFAVDVSPVFRDTKFKSTYDGGHGVNGRFRGFIEFDVPGQSNLFLWGTYSAIDYGSVSVNGVVVATNQVLVPTINEQTGNYELRATDARNIVSVNSSTPATVFIQYNPTVFIPLMQPVQIIASGVGQVTIAPSPGSGVVINGTPGLKLRAQNSVVTLIQIALNNWVAYGDLTS